MDFRIGQSLAIRIEYCLDQFVSILFNPIGLGVVTGVLLVSAANDLAIQIKDNGFGASSSDINANQIVFLPCSFLHYCKDISLNII